LAPPAAVPTAEPTAVPSAALRIEGLTAGYRGVPVLHGVTFDVEPGQVVGLVGPNGAGKSTLLDAVCGTLRPTTGRVYLFGRDVTRLPVHRRARLGLGRTFQALEPFGSLSIADNLLVAAEASMSHSDGHVQTPTSLTTVSRLDGQAEAIVHVLLRRFGLVDFADQPLAVVPTGVARIVEIARALAAGARVLLLDEPSSGMSEQQVSEFASTVRALRGEGLSILLVEHDATLVDAVCDRVYELGTGASAYPGPGLSRAGGWRPAPSTSG
jgi:branched-chain amino acid transport system ATP-binding protein